MRHHHEAAQMQQLQTLEFWFLKHRNFRSGNDGNKHRNWNQTGSGFAQSGKWTMERRDWGKETEEDNGQGIKKEEKKRE